jgi:PAS domain S-box-containing protein
MGERLHRRRSPTARQRRPVLAAEFSAAIIEHIADPVFVKDRAFRFVFVNRALCDLMGRTRDDIVGKDDYDFFPEAEADFFREKDRTMFETGEVQRIEEESLTDASGRRHAISTTKVPLRDGATVTHLVGILHDVTAKKAAEETLLQANETLERRVGERTAALAEAQEELVRSERLALLGQLAGGLAHQVRNPLGAISNAASILRKLASVRQDPQAVQLAGIVFDEAWKANTTITALLECARIRPAMIQGVALWPVVQQALADQALPARVRVVAEVSALPAVNVDAEQVRQAVGNIIQNALEAMADGGVLTLSAHAKGDTVCLTIADTGPGMSAEVASTLFQPLLTTKSDKFGLGLTTAQLLIKNQKGTISFETARGKGTRFAVVLPVDHAGGTRGENAAAEVVRR